MNETSYNPNDRIYITEITGSKINMLYCDANGVLSTGYVDNSLKETIKQILSALKGAGKYGAVVCLEIGAGQFVTLGTEIDYQEAAALPAIHDFVFNTNKVSGIIPEQYISSIKKIINKVKIKAVEQGYKLRVPALKLEQEFDPTLHLILLAPNEKTPIIFESKLDTSRPSSIGQITCGNLWTQQ